IPAATRSPSPTAARRTPFISPSTSTSVRCIIVEDEPLAVARLTEYVAALPLLRLVGTFDNAADALSFLLANPVDLLFLDINLGDMSGIEMLETTAVSAQTILTTAHADFA